MSKILTITIPTYNVEKYLGQCLDSLLIPELLDDIEVLIVNDGSSDSSQTIAKKYSERYPDTFILIEKENGGHGSTINTGIEAARGKYFKVVDGDDWVDKVSMVHLIKTLQGCESDLVYSNYYWVDNSTGKKTVEFKQPFENVEYGKEYLFEDLPENMFLKMHGFTVRTEILHKIPPIDEHCFYVDMEYVVFPIPHIRTVRFIPDFVYQYRIGLSNQSMSAERMQRNAENYDRVMKRLFQYYEEQIAAGLSGVKESYIAHVLARMFASRIKIYLSCPYSQETLEEMRQRDEYIRIHHPQIYNANCNSAVEMLRKTKYSVYMLARGAYCVKQKRFPKSEKNKIKK